jgi:hypothetical protein
MMVAGLTIVFFLPLPDLGLLPRILLAGLDPTRPATRDEGRRRRSPKAAPRGHSGSKHGRQSSKSPRSTGEVDDIQRGTIGAAADRQYLGAARCSLGRARQCAIPHRRPRDGLKPGHSGANRALLDELSAQMNSKNPDTHFTSTAVTTRGMPPTPPSGFDRSRQRQNPAAPG